MSTNSYTNVNDLHKSYRRFIETSGLTPDELEFFVENSEIEINGLLSGRYQVPFTGGNVPPMVRNLTLRLAGYNFLRAQIIQEDSSRSDWVEGIRASVMESVQGLLDNKLNLLTGSGTITDGLPMPGSTIWSNTMDFVPTMGLLPVEDQLIDSGRIALEEDRREDL